MATTANQERFKDYYQLANRLATTQATARQIAAVFWGLMMVCVSWASEQAANPPATKLEAFQARTGTVRILGYTTVGTMRGLLNVITVQAREWRDASNPSSRATGVLVKVKEMERGRESGSFVDADEIDSLLKGIEYLMKTGRNVTTHENFQAEYKTKGDLRVSVYSDSKGEISASVETGGIGHWTAIIKLSQLEEFRKLILAAKMKL